MTLSLWRYAHLTLAIFASLFLVMASLSGAILAFDAIQEKVPSYKSTSFDELKLSEVLPVLKKKYEEISALEVDYNGYVTLKAMDSEGNDVEGIINPQTGEIIAKPLVKSDFMLWVTAFHRSMFLKETGRLMIGIVSFLLILIAISGFLLILQRQQSINRFFSKVVKEYFTQYYHVIFGRIMLIPILILAVTGTYLSMVRFQLFDTSPITINNKVQTLSDEFSSTKLADNPLFKNTKLSDVTKVEFPFSDEPDDYFILKLKNEELTVNQYNGDIIQQIKYPVSQVLDNISLDWHTGRTSPILAIILGLASLNILFFIFSGFAITLKRGSSKIRNRNTADNAEYVFLVGSESGSTLQFANAIHHQLLAQHKHSFLCELNKYQVFPRAKHLIIFTSTYGVGDAPTNAENSLKLIENINQNHDVNYSVVGFGSTDYDDFCQFAININNVLSQKSWAVPYTEIHTVDDKSTDQFVEWVKNWSNKAEIELSVTPAVYQNKPKDLVKMMVVDRTEINENEHSFKITIHCPTRCKFSSGDLLAIYPNKDGRERLYSIAKIDGNIQLIVKHYENGLGSGFLNQLKVGSTLMARHIPNKKFNYPEGKKVIFIANGTGLAPFLGMLDEAKTNADNYLYLGFRNETSLVSIHRASLDKLKKNKKLCEYQIAFSRSQNYCYVMDLIKQDEVKIAKLLQEGAVIMICGSIAMQKDVEKVLNTICLTHNNCELSKYKRLGRLKTDCY